MAGKMKGYDESTIIKIFNQTPAKAVLKNPDALNPDSDFVPEKILFREKQVFEITNILSQVLLGFNPSNAILRGPTGTGKTVTIKFLLSAFEKSAREKGINVGIGYASGHVLGTGRELSKVSPHRYIAELMNSLGFSINASKRGGYGWGRLIDMFRDYLNDSNYDYLIFVLDDIHRLSEIPFFMHLARPKQVWNLKKNLTVFYITTTEKFIKLIPREGAYSFENPNIYFAPYNAMQLKDIIKQRLEYALNEPKIIPEEAISLIAAYGTQMGGDARYTLRVLKEFVNRYILGYYEEMELESAVKNAFAAIDIEDIHELIKSLSFTSKVILTSLIRYEYFHGFKFGSYTIPTVYRIYYNFCKDVGFRSVLTRSFNEHLYSLINNYLLDHKRGVRGRLGTVSLENIRSLLLGIISALQSDESLSNIIDFEKIKDKYSKQSEYYF